MNKNNGKIEVDGMIFKKEITEKRINQYASSLARIIDHKYGHLDEPLMILVIMDSAVMFATQVIRNLQNIFPEVQYIKASSYYGATESSGEVRISQIANGSVFDRDVLIIDDILDTGNTLTEVIKQVEARGAKSIRSAVMLKSARYKGKESDVKLSSFGFKVDGFMLGYGMDYKGLGRNLPDLYIHE